MKFNYLQVNIFIFMNYERQIMKMLNFYANGGYYTGRLLLYTYIYNYPSVIYIFFFKTRKRK
jgi:hypothetical protein